MMNAVSDILIKTLKDLFLIKEIKSDFYLAGGTNLAIQYNHRVSTDIDLFCLPNFEKNLEFDILPLIEEVFPFLKKR